MGTRVEIASVEDKEKQHHNHCTIYPVKIIAAVVFACARLILPAKALLHPLKLLFSFVVLLIGVVLNWFLLFAHCLECYLINRQGV